MRTRSGLAILVAGVIAAAGVLVSIVRPVSGRAQSGAMPRSADGKPDFTGIWQAMNSANWDLLPHEARRGPVIALGAAFSVPAGPGVVEGNEIPYLPEAAAKKKENAANWLARDPEIKCFLPGVPRMIYMPYPIQIVQGRDTILMASEFASASRTIRMNSKEKSPTDSWMGWSIGRWEGDALVIEVTDQTPQTWFDRAGDFHSEALKVVERFTVIDRNTINYEATMEDPKVFSRPWKISMPLYRHLEKNAQMMEYKCVEFVEELMYGHLRKQPTAP
ncbi:MAG TPA: hypothetical protein VKE51_33730 [Vicinamibacterales bacterium]|nr:hypothetical protein [Vicinamibacterales bacterium]